MNWYYSLTGFLVIKLWGRNPEKVINMAMNRGIHVWDITQLEEGVFLLKIRISAYKALRFLARRSSCRLKIAEKHGIPFLLAHAGKRKVLVSGIVFFLIMLYVLGSFVWSIDIIGNKQISSEEILKIAEANGLKVGRPISGFNRDIIKEELISQLPKLAWVSIQVQGTRVIVEVSERTLIPKNDENKPGDLVARENGQIKELLILQGTAMVKEKDKVQKGQTLIAGLVYPQIQINPDGSITPGGIPEMIRARGLVRAEVTRESIGECHLIEDIYRDTGAESTLLSLRFKGRDVILKGPKTLPYQYYRQFMETNTLFEGRNQREIVELISIIYFEQKYQQVQWGIEGAYQEAARRAKEQIMRQLPDDNRIIAENYEPVTSGDSGLIKVRCILETLEDIGGYGPNS